jgi:hypothetical protein
MERLSGHLYDRQQALVRLKLRSTSDWLTIMADINTG